MQKKNQEEEKVVNNWRGNQKPYIEERQTIQWPKKQYKRQRTIY